MPTLPYTYGALACTGWVLFVILVRGASDWSESLAVSFYGAMAAAVVLSLTGAAMAIGDRGLASWKRLAAIATGILIPTSAILTMLAIIVAVSHTR